MSGSPGKYSRPGGPEAIYQAVISAQNSVRQQEIEAKKKQKLQQQLLDAKNKEAKLLKQKNDLNTQLAPFQAELASRTLDYKLPGSLGGFEITPTEQGYLDAYSNAYIKPILTKLAVVNKDYADAVAARKNIETQLQSFTTQEQKTTLNNKKVSKDTTKKDNSPVKDSAGYNPITYVYNAPMIGWAYLNPNGPQQGVKVYSGGTDPDPNASNMLVRPLGAPSSAVENAESSWMNKAYSSKGTIQMNTVFNTNVMAGAEPGVKYDDQLYGFRFLYNPKEVSMTWGLAEGVNYEAVQTGLDKSTPISTGLLNSTISFSLLLNRMGDMQYLNEDGLIPGVTNPYPEFNRGKGKTLDKELSEIFKRGTMYDLEYLFKTIMGISATYKSGLNGETADKGWLQGIPVDLHLGDGLRYQVRIGGLDVNHMIFNDRMVPILSTVNVTCHRFYDLAQTPSNTSAGARGRGRGALLTE